MSTNKMKLFINEHQYISVLKEKETYKCAVMCLIHGSGMYPATIHSTSDDIVYSMDYSFGEDTSSLTTDKLSEVFDWHKELMIKHYSQVTENNAELA